MQSERTGAVCILGAGILWGTVGLFVKRLNACGASPEMISFLREMFAAVIMTVIGLLRSGRKCFRVRRRTLAACALLGFVGQGIYNVFRSFAVIYAGVGVSTVLQNIAPAVTLLCSVRLFGERITLQKSAAVVLCIVGCALAATDGKLSSSLASPAGILFSLGAGLCFGLTPVFSRLADESDDPVSICIFSFWFAAVFLGIWLRPWNGLPTVNTGIIGWGFLYALIPTALAYVLYYHGVQLIHETGRIPVLGSTETVAAVLLGCIVFRETLGTGRFFGIVLVLCAIILMNTRIKRRIAA